ncbi:thioredoxin family protein [Candidatus Babeliales bacterium]|nr:thioredoxin family protein [Candidatus Babeliales bacterium]MBP9844319.1 thioredoxin family protein [Candidatus Babeliales bacterium]
MNKTMMLLLFLLHTTITQPVEFSSTTEYMNEKTQEVTIHCKLDTNNNETILANSLHTSIDNPGLEITKTTFSCPASRKHVQELNQKKQVYYTDFDVIITLDTKTDNLVQAMLHLSYLSTLNSSILDVQIPVTFHGATESHEQIIAAQKANTMPTPTELEIEKKDQSWTAMIQNIVEQSKSPWTQILFAVLLGLLLSLTPCIYPMIPITIGILHSQGRKSLFHDFLGSLCYASGLATTFACLGLLATVAGSSFGSLLSHPPFVIGLVLFISYMSLTMIGIIDMYIPSFMKGEVKLYRNLGPFFAAYLFGAISGTIASPCVSPGLALLLSIVATLGNKILGFLLLFAFGIGLSIPLIIIGTFSNSLYLLPKSGMWMVEIKKALGFFMMATCFYYLGNILPAAIVYWLFTGFTLFTALFYLVGTDKNNTQYKKLYTLIGIIMISLTVLMATKSYEKTFYNDSSLIDESIDWQADYATALDQAKENNKLLLIDFWAHHCTICKAIDKKVFHNNFFRKALSDTIVFVKIDATHSDNSDYIHTKELYKVYAQPTILLVDPVTQTVLKKWTSEPYSLSIEEFVKQIQNKMKL